MTKAVLGGLGAALVFLFLAGSVTGHSDRLRKELTVAEVLDKLASAANAKKGQEVRPNIIVIRASVENGRHLTYYYMIPTVADGQHDPVPADDVIEDATRRSCADLMQRRAVEGGAEIRYVYRQSDGATIFSVDIDQWVCAGVSLG